MKRVTSIFLIMLITGMSFFVTGCYGTFTLTKKMLYWNGTVGNRLEKEAVFLIFCILPVYEGCVFIDAVFLNLIEFWSGSNPLALQEGINHVKIKGQDIKICLHNNNAIIYNSMNQEIARLNFKENENTWYATVKGKTTKLMTIENNLVKIYTPSGKIINVCKSDLDSKATFLKYNQLLALK